MSWWRLSQKLFSFPIFRLWADEGYHRNYLVFLSLDFELMKVITGTKGVPTKVDIYLIIVINWKTKMMIENDEHTYSLNDQRYLKIDIINFIYWSLNLRKLKMCHLNGLVEIWYLIFNSINPYMKQSWTYVARKKILIVLVPSWQKNWRWNVIVDVDCDETKYDAQN